MEEGKIRRGGEERKRIRKKRKEGRRGEERRDQFTIHRLRNSPLLPSTNSTSLCRKGVGNLRELKAEARMSVSLCSQHCKQLEGEPPGVR